MAGESRSLPGTPEITKRDGGDLRRSSMGKESSSNSREKVPPHYLRASTGSCHDFCKYGRKHVLEETKARRPMRKRMPAELAGGRNSVEILKLPQKERMSVVKPNPSPKPRTHMHNTSEVIKKELLTKSPNNSSVITKPEVSTKSPNDQKSLGNVVLSEKKVSAVKFKHIPPSSRSHRPDIVKRELRRKSLGDNSDIINWDMSKELPDGQNTTNSLVQSEKKTSTVKIKPVLSAKAHQTISPKLRKLKLPLNPETVEASARQVPSKAKEKNQLLGRATALKLKSAKEKPSTSSDFSGGLKGRTNSDTKIGKRSGFSKLVVKKVSVPTSASLTPRRALLSPKLNLVRIGSLNARKNKNLKVLLSPKNQIKIKKAEPEESKDGAICESSDPIQEKTLYVIKMETEEKLLESHQNERCAIDSSPTPSSSSPQFPVLSSPSPPSHNEGDQEESECTVTEGEDDSLSENTETMSTEEAETSEEENKLRLRKGGLVSSEDKDQQPVKLHFRRGKVVDIQSENNNSPRRLKFRRGRVLGENERLKAEARRSFRRRVVDGGDTADSKPGAEKVVLRHQDVQQGKKDAQGLFNNVIEETASKLVETRKSKVKALVGAFETVISLTGSKPSANTDS